jgi:predicted transcriptional regulator
MNDNELNSIFEQISKIKKPTSDAANTIDSNDLMRKTLNGVTSEIQRVLDENDYTQEDLCQITNMSQSNISKILNGKVIPRLETLQKIAEATHTRLIISFENIEGEG